MSQAKSATIKECFSSVTDMTCSCGKAAIPGLPNLPEPEGCLVTIGAMGCWKAIAERIREKQADYVLASEGIHGNMYGYIRLFSDEIRENGSDRIPVVRETTDGGHVRIGIRRYQTTDEIGWLFGKENRKDTDIIKKTTPQRISRYSGILLLICSDKRHPQKELLRQNV